MCANDALSSEEHLHSIVRRSADNISHTTNKEHVEVVTLHLFCDMRDVKSQLFCGMRDVKSHLVCDTRDIKLHLFGAFTM